MTMHGVTGRGYFHRPVFVGTPGRPWDEMEGLNVRRVPFYGLGQGFKFTKEE